TLLLELNKESIARLNSGITDSSEKDKDFIEKVKNLIEQKEKELVGKRFMRGQKQRMKDGNGWGRPPLGYIYNHVTKKIEIDEKFAWVISAIDQMFLEENLGMKAVADKLKEISRGQNGERLNEGLVYRSLLSKAYHGVMEKRIDGETIAIENLYPPLRTEETWRRIQGERNRRRDLYKGSSSGHIDLKYPNRTPQ
ncbi:recombinase family protein, partial [Bacillus sp. DJP31]|uniref:recombinase family protein n=1 Tax=Bacillus sp. DJP31 TaxID=3409789 RepID=UPI003BB4EBA9